MHQGAANNTSRHQITKTAHSVGFHRCRIRREKDEAPAHVIVECDAKLKKSSTVACRFIGARRINKCILHPSAMQLVLAAAPMAWLLVAHTNKAPVLTLWVDMSLGIGTHLHVRICFQHRTTPWTV